MLHVVADDKIPFLKGVLEPFAEVRYLPGSKIARADLVNADALLTRTRTKCNAELLDGTSVKFIASATIGYDHIDTDYCRSRGIFWTNAPGCNSSSVAQYITSLLLCLSVRTKQPLAGATLGVVGVGNVGSKVARNARLLGMNVLLNDPPRARAEGPEQFVSIEAIRKEADFITFHVPLIRNGPDATFHYADEAFFNSLARKPFVINSSRGEVADNAALRHALENGQLAGAALDVWENEPDIDLDLMAKLDFATPHIAGYSSDGKANGTAMSLLALAKFFSLKLDASALLSPPAPPGPLIGLDAKAGEPREELLWRAVAAAYDIREDDRRLRAAPAEFEKQRGAYPLRREFPAYTVSAAPPSLENIFRGLGFSIRKEGRILPEKETFRAKARRVILYYYNKAMREKGSPEYIARGWALGFFVGLAFPVGCQLVVAIPLAFVVKGSKMGAVLGTFNSNNFTLIFIYPFQCWLGNLILGGNLTIAEITKVLEGVIRDQDFHALFSLGLETLFSFLLGGLILGLVSIPPCYYLVKFMVIRYRARKEKIRKAKEALRQKAQPEQSHETAGNH
ncbi:MAG: Erythronate-4-phosphate dehydrogenase [Lentisphaerae bacterium ADurb.Bin242]|nr:MAG: Erythronate-4-phosphate dehydrogenase [Lentisphaerae bacterium ADurb.Bin242]